MSSRQQTLCAGRERECVDDALSRNESGGGKRLWMGTGTRTATGTGSATEAATATGTATGIATGTAIETATGTATGQEQRLGWEAGMG